MQTVDISGGSYRVVKFWNEPKLNWSLTASSRDNIEKLSNWKPLVLSYQDKTLEDMLFGSWQIQTDFIIYLTAILPLRSEIVRDSFHKAFSRNLPKR